MTESTELPPAARRYLEQLAHESTVLPEGSRQQLLGQIREHLSEALEEEAQVGPVLERLGHPRELVRAAGDDEPPAAEPAPRLNALLWLAIAATIAGALMLLMGGGMFALTGRWRSIILPALPGIVLAITGLVLLIRELRAMRSRPTAALEAQRIRLGLGVAALAAGLIVLGIGGGMFALTGRWRSIILPALPGIVLAITGAVLLLLAKRPRSAAHTGD